MNLNKNRVNRYKTRVEQKSRLGAAVVEFAVVAPVMMLLTMGMIEIGRMVMVKQVMLNASREGARLGALPGVSNQEVTNRVQEELRSASIVGVEITVTPIALSESPAGTPVTVQLNVSASQISWVPNPLFSFSKEIEASTSMRRESL